MRAASSLLLLAAAFGGGCGGGALPAATLWIADRDGGAIRAFDPRTGAALDADMLARRPSSATFDDDGLLYTVDFDRDEVLRYRMLDGALEAVVLDDSSVLREPVQIDYRDHRLLVLGKDSRNLVLLDESGRLIRDIGRDRIWSGHDLAVAADGSVFVANAYSLDDGGLIQVWDPESGEQVARYGPLETLGSAVGIELGPDGSMYVADEIRQHVVRFSGDRFERSEILTTAEDVPRPISLTLDLDAGVLLILGADGVHRYDVEAGEYQGRLIDDGEAALIGPRHLVWRRDG